MKPNREPTTQITNDPALLAGAVRPPLTDAVGSIGNPEHLDRAIGGAPSRLDPMSAVTDNPAKGGCNVRGYVADCLDHGSDPADLRRQLVALGYKPENANQIVQEMAFRGRNYGRWLNRSPAAHPVDRRNRTAGGWIMALGTAAIIVGALGTCAGLLTWVEVAEAGFALMLIGGWVFARGAEWTTVGENKEYRTRKGHESSKMDDRPPPSLWQ